MNNLTTSTDIKLTVILLLIYFFAIRPRNIAAGTEAEAAAEGGIAAPGALGAGGTGLGGGFGGAYGPGRIGMGRAGYRQTGWGGTEPPMMAGAGTGAGSMYAPGVVAPGMAPDMTGGAGYGANSNIVSVPQTAYTGTSYPVSVHETHS